VRKRVLRAVAGAAALSFAAARAGLAQQRFATTDLVDLSLEQLSKVTVSSVSGRNEPLSGALGSIFVITGDDIRRYGATTLPEALRLAPNLEVAQSGTNGWAITARGFNDTLANKLLVLIDGRVIYSPTFSGVFWDAQDVMLPDIDRIEVISGPGGVLWGANAVNGVINILTRTADQTQNSLVYAGAGTIEERLEGRYGGSFGETGHYRAYAQGSSLDDSVNPDGTRNLDGADRVQAGTRFDWTKGKTVYTAQGDAYRAVNHEEPDPAELRGVNALGRLSHDFQSGDNLRVQAYYDFTSRPQQKLDTGDIELTHTLHPRGRNTFIWGGGARQARDRIEDSAVLAIIPEDKTLNYWNVYGQDEIALPEHMAVTAGARVDRNPYTGAEFLPSVRYGWRPSTEHLVWAAWSRAVREPARFDRELFIPGTPPFLLSGGPDFESEIAYVYEIGYRGQPLERLSWSATVFYHDLQKQRTVALVGTTAVVANGFEGHSQGIETWGTYRVLDRWRLSGGYTHFDKEETLRPGEINIAPPANTGSDPDEWWSVKSSLDLPDRWEIDVLVRTVGQLDTISVPQYTAADARVGWILSQHAELSLFLRNLFDDAHVEWSPGAEWGRSAFFKTLVRF
jgi:iron complex outermembrane receptor protein